MIDYTVEDENDRVRSIEKNGVKFTVTQKDPYGFCYITWESSEKLPKDFDGAFTTFNEAFHVIEVYTEKNKELPKKKMEAKLS